MIRLSIVHYDEIAKKDLVVDEKIVPEAEKIFSLWFDQYSENNRMMNVHLGKFLRDVVNHHEMPSLDDSRITGLFDTYDSANNGYLDRDGFVKFYVTATFDRRGVVWENIRTMGIRNDLKTVRYHLFSYFLALKPPLSLLLKLYKSFNYPITLNFNL